MVKQIASTVPAPDRGAFYVHVTSTGARYPDDGRGTPTDQAGDAVWADMGLAAGEFEVVVENVSANVACTSVTLTPVNASDDPIVLTMVGTFPHAYKLDVGLRDGFHVTLTGTGPQATVTFRVQKYT